MKRTEQPTHVTLKTLIVGVQAPYNRAADIESYFEEFKNLVRTLEVDYEEFVKIKLRDIDGATFIGSGNVKKLADLCVEKKIKQVIFSEPLTIQQERNLNELLHCPVYDRTRLILEIFEAAATSAEGKLQVEIAMLKNKKSRLAGRGIHLAQQEGRIGTRGPGETEKEVATRHIEEQIRKLKQQLDHLEQTRATQRKQRRIKQIPHICLIGYTNAGKSTILNTLTKADVLAENKLFATLDTTTRELYVNNTKVGLLSDTVGFIQSLPHQLIDAFKSTLAELQYADLLLHVVDISDKNWPSHIQVVHEVLKDLAVDKPMLYVFNKADRVDMSTLYDAIAIYQPHVVITATARETMQPLIEFLATWKPQAA